MTNHEQNLRNVKTFEENWWNRGILNGCFEKSPKIKVSDVDGEIELYGNYLVFECKNVGATLSGGQRIALERKVKQGLTTVFIVYGKKDQPEFLEVWYPNGVKTDKKPINLEVLRNYVSRWEEWSKHNEVVEVKVIRKTIPYTSKYKGVM